ncbi:MAG TPA: hypothetical protein VMS98_04380 [Thermoanaerobaculia bacterium]|nr:hypothetical protein [Thermoanaerobaculia bacterium]
MPFDLLGLLVVIFIIWLVLKVARVAIRLIVFVITATIILAAVYWFFMR